MENQRDQQDETPAAASSHVSILEYYRRERSRTPERSFPPWVPDNVRATIAGAVAVVMGGCAWLAISESFHVLLAPYGQRDTVSDDWTTREVSIVFLTIMCCACWSARAYWIRWRRDPEFWNRKARQEDESDEPPIAFREEE